MHNSLQATCHFQPVPEKAVTTRKNPAETRHEQPACNCAGPGDAFNPMQNAKSIAECQCMMTAGHQSFCIRHCQLQNASEYAWRMNRLKPAGPAGMTS
jgi:hypothetical protein